MNYLELFESFNVNINESHGISPLVEYLLPYYMKSINKLNKNNLYIDFIDFLKETEEKGIDYSFYKKYFIEIPFEIIEKGFNQFYKEKKNFKLNKEKHKFATFLFINDPKCGAGLYKNEFLEINQNENDNKILFLIGVNYYHLNADSDDIMSKIKCNIDDILSHEIKHMIDSIFYDNPLEKIKTYNNYNDNDIYLLDPEENKARISEYCNGIKKIKDINMIADILKILYKIKNIKYDDFIEQRYEISDKIEKFEDDIFKYYKKFPPILNIKHILKLYYSCNTLLFRPYKDLKYILKSKRRNNKKVVERILKIEGKFINNLIKITYDRYVELNNNSSNKKINESFTSKVIKDKKRNKSRR